jgi:hypothetical protein
VPSHPRRRLTRTVELTFSSPARSSQRQTACFALGCGDRAGRLLKNASPGLPKDLTLFGRSTAGPASAEELAQGKGARCDEDQEADDGDRKEGVIHAPQSANAHFVPRPVRKAVVGIPATERSVKGKGFPKMGFHSEQCVAGERSALIYWSGNWATRKDAGCSSPTASEEI